MKAAGREGFMLWATNEIATKNGSGRGLLVMVVATKLPELLMLRKASVKQDALTREP